MQFKTSCYVCDFFKDHFWGSFTKSLPDILLIIDADFTFLAEYVIRRWFCVFGNPCQDNWFVCNSLLVKSNATPDNLRETWGPWSKTQKLGESWDLVFDAWNARLKNYNRKQNIWNKIKKPIKIEQPLRNFWLPLPKFYLWRGDCTPGSISTQ